MTTAVTSERVEWLTGPLGRVLVPELFVPRAMRNSGNFVISLGELCQWLASQAEALGVSVLPGFGFRSRKCRSNMRRQPQRIRQLFRCGLQTDPLQNRQ